MEDQSIRNSQSINDGQGYQVNDPQDVVVLGNGNTINVHRGEAPQSRSQTTGTPHNLSYRGAIAFVGRDEELRTLHEQLQESQTVSIVSIRGMGGIGKTELALQYASRSKTAGLYSGGLCWMDAASDVGLQLIQFARTYLDVEPPDTLDLVGRVAFCLRHWQPGEVLLVIDNVQEYDPIAQLFRGMESRFKVLLTTRSQIEQDSVSVVAIETLKPLQAFELLYQTMRDESRFVQGQGKAEELCEWLGYLPLGIKLIAKFLKVEPDLSIEAALQELKAEKLKHDGLTKIEIVFELSWEKLTAAERQLAMVLGAFGKAAIGWELVDRAIKFGRVEAEAEPVEQWCLLLEPKTLKRRRRRLIELSLLQRVEAEQYLVHPLLREFFVGKMTQEERKSIKTAVAMVMIEIAKQISQNPTLEMICAVTGAIPHLQAVGEDLVQLRSREECGIADDDDLTWVLSGISRFYWEQGLYADAEPWFVARLEVARSLLGENHPDIANILSNLASLYQSQGRYQQAEPLCLQALELTRSLLGENHSDVASILNNLASLYQLQGRYQQAEPLCLQALELTRSLLGDYHPNVVTSLNNLASLYQLQGRYEQAESLYIDALQIGIQTLEEDHPGVAILFINLADLYQTSERYAEVEPLYLQALAILHQRLGESHPCTQQIRQGFIDFLVQVMQGDRLAELSDHPITRSLLEQLQTASNE